jgi:hypothetical protein
VSVQSKNKLNFLHVCLFSKGSVFFLCMPLFFCVVACARWLHTTVLLAWVSAVFSLAHVDVLGWSTCAGLVIFLFHLSNSHSFI